MAACQEAHAAAVLLQGAAAAQAGCSFLAASLPLTHLACLSGGGTAQRRLAAVQLATQLSQRRGWAAAEQVPSLLPSRLVLIGSAWISGSDSTDQGPACAPSLDRIRVQTLYPEPCTLSRTRDADSSDVAHAPHAGGWLRQRWDLPAVFQQRPGGTSGRLLPNHLDLGF